VLTLILATLSTGQASGYFYPDVGVGAIGRGGANVAGADDLSALWYNPAALRRISGPRLDFELSTISQSVRYQRASDIFLDEADEEYLVNYDAVEDQAQALPVPTLGFANDFGLDKTTFAFGFNTPMAPPVHSYDAAGAQRYNLVSSEMIQASFGPALAHQVNDWLTLGLGLTGNVLRIKQDLDIHMFIPLTGFDLGDLGDPAGDVGFSIAAQDSFLLSANAGLLVEPKDGRWAFGLSFRPPTTYTADGTIVADFSHHFLYESEDPSKEIILDSTATSDMQVIVKMPMVIKAGLLVRPSSVLEIEADFVWEGWSVNDALVIKDVNFLVETTLAPVEIITDVELPAGFQDSWSVRLGGEYILNDDYSIRAGALYEVSAVPTSSLGLGQIDMNKYGYGTGLVWRLNEKMSLDASFGQLFFESAEVTDSATEAVMVNAISGEVEEDAFVVGNGVYESSAMMGGLSLSYVFGH
jgi:long-chain fatty acid transport protein